MSSLLSLAFFALVVLFGACAMLLGVVTGFSALATGSLQMSYAVGGHTTIETVSRISDPGRFWTLVMSFAALPACAGAAALWWGLQRLKAGS